MTTQAPAPPAPPAPASKKMLLTKRELSETLPMPERTIEKFVATGIIPALKITPRMIRFELPAVLGALRQYQTATLQK